MSYSKPVTPSNLPGLFDNLGTHLTSQQENYLRVCIDMSILGLSKSDISRLESKYSIDSNPNMHLQLTHLKPDLYEYTNMCNDDNTQLLSIIIDNIKREYPGVSTPDLAYQALSRMHIMYADHLLNLYVNNEIAVLDNSEYYELKHELIKEIIDNNPPKLTEDDITKYIEPYSITNEDHSTIRNRLKGIVFDIDYKGIFVNVEKEMKKYICSTVKYNSKYMDIPVTEKQIYKHAIYTAFNNIVNDRLSQYNKSYIEANEI